MTVSEETEHLVYLLTRKSDSKQYVGITMSRRIKQRMGDHKRSNRFKGDAFTVEILEKSFDREFIEKREEYWIEELGTYHNGLNESISGKGYGHNSKNFTTLGYRFTDKQRKKMSESAKNRVDRDKMRQISNDMWADEKMRKHHSEIRKGKRLRKPKISDSDVLAVRERYKKEYESIKKECDLINKERHAKNPSWKKTNPAQLFGNKYSEHYNLSNTLLKNIVLNKTRTEVLPMMRGENK